MPRGIMPSEPDPIEETASATEGDGAEVQTEDSTPAPDDPEWSGLLNYLLNARGFDFHGYKPASLARRIRKRMDAVGIGGFAAYQDYLEVHPNEFATLF